MSIALPLPPPALDGGAAAADEEQQRPKLSLMELLEEDQAKAVVIEAENVEAVNALEFFYCELRRQPLGGGTQRGQVLRLSISVAA